MNSEHKAAQIAGILFLTAMVTSLLGGGLLESILNAPDYLSNITENTSRAMTGIFLELINAVAVVGIAFMLFPVLKRHSEYIAVGYVSFRIIESIFCIVSSISPLLLITLSREYIKTGITDAVCLQTVGTILIASRTYATGLLIPLFFSLGALLLYGLLYQSKLVPRFISVWGLIGVVLVLVVNLVEVGMTIGMILALPIILNEIFLGIWLIVKGFNPFALASGTVKTDSYLK